MNNSINQFRYSPFSSVPNSASQRRPVIIEGEKTTVSGFSPQNQSTSTTPKTASVNQQNRILEAQLIPDNEQLFGQKQVLTMRTPLAAFSEVLHPFSRLGSSVDTYA